MGHSAKRLTGPNDTLKGSHDKTKKHQHLQLDTHWTCARAERVN